MEYRSKGPFILYLLLALKCYGRRSGLSLSPFRNVLSLNRAKYDQENHSKIVLLVRKAATRRKSVPMILLELNGPCRMYDVKVFHLKHSKCPNLTKQQLL